MEFRNSQLSMTAEEEQKRIKRLRAEIARLRGEYHTHNAPGVTDEVYDSLNRELKGLIKKHPEFDDPNAPEYRVAGKPLLKFIKVHHQTPLLSIGNAFSTEELLAWEKRNAKLLPPGIHLDYFAELKFDGLAVSLIYENGKFVRGATRGDGKIGEDITENLKMIGTLPLVLQAPFPERIEVRGEAVMKKEVLALLNKKNQKEGKILFANSRNAAAGGLRQLDPALARERRLDFFAYEIASVVGAQWQKYFARHSLKHELLAQLGFMVDQHTQKSPSLSALFDFIQEVASVREKLAFGIDGVVISVDDTELFNRLGVAGKDPRGVIAFKYPAERVTTILQDIKINVGRTGALTPLAILKPVSVAGSTVAKATLHNMDQINRLDLRLGDTVVIEKAGDVIPKVLEALTRLRTGKEKKFKMPKACPACGGKVEKKKLPAQTSVAHFCANTKCPAKNERYLEHFVSVFQIYELGPKILRRFRDEGLITDAADLFTLTGGDISSLARFGEKSAHNIINEINDKKEVPLSRFLWALGILHVGEETARDLAEHFGTLESIVVSARKNLAEIDSIDNIGAAVSKSLHDFFSERHNLDFLAKLQQNGVVIQRENKKLKGKLSGMSFVLTGTLETMSRQIAKERILALDGKVLGAVSKNTSYLVSGADPGSKLKTAERLGVKILDEPELIKLIG